MEALLVGAFLIKLETVIKTITELEPFLNIDQKLDFFVYGMIITMKTVYVLYAMENAIPKAWSLTCMGIGKCYLLFTRPKLAFFAYINFVLNVFGLFFPQMTMMGMLSISYKPYEFLLDISVILCSLYYAVETYKREIDKLLTVIGFALCIGAFVNNVASVQQFGAIFYGLIIWLCLLTIFPLSPHRSKYWYRVIYFYMVLCAWICYKGCLHLNQEKLSTLHTGNKTDVCMIIEHKYQAEKCGLNETLENWDDSFMKRLNLSYNRSYDKKQELFEHIHHLKENQLKDNIYPTENIKLTETMDLKDYKDDQIAVETFPEADTALGDTDYKIEKRLGNAESIDNGVLHESAHKTIEIIETSNKPEQQGSWTEESITFTEQTFSATESRELLFEALASDPSEASRVKNVESRTTDVGEKVEIASRVNEAIKLQTSKATEAEISETEESKIFENENIYANESKTIFSEIAVAQTTDYHTTATPSTGTDALRSKTINDIEALKSPATKTYKFSEREDNVPDTVPKESSDAKVTQPKTQLFDAEPIVSTATEACEKEFTMVKHIRPNEYETCKAIDLPANADNQINKSSDFSSSELKPFKTKDANTKLKTSETTYKAGFYNEPESIDNNKKKTILFNALDLDNSRKVSVDRSAGCQSNAILGTGKTGSETTVFRDSETTAPQATIYRHISARDAKDSREFDLIPSKHEASASESKKTQNDETESIEVGKFAATDVQGRENQEHEFSSNKASDSGEKELTFSSDSNISEIKLEPPEEGEDKNFHSDIIKARKPRAVEDDFRDNEDRIFQITRTEKILYKGQPDKHQNEAFDIKAGDARETRAFYTGATELKATNQAYQREIKIVNIGESEEIKFKHTKSSKTREIENAYTGATEIKATKDVLRAIESKPIQNQDSDTAADELGHNVVIPPGRKETKISDSHETEDNPVKVAGVEESDLKPRKCRETRKTYDAYTGATEIQATKSNLFQTIESKPTQGATVENSVVSELVHNVVEMKEFEDSKSSYSNSMEIERIEVANPKESKFKLLKSSDSRNSYSKLTMNSENIQTQTNKATEPKDNKIEISDNKNNLLDVRESLPILSQKHASNQLNKASNDEGIQYKTTETVYENKATASDDIGSEKTKTKSVNDFEASESKSNKIGEASGHQAMESNPVSKTKSEENQIQDGPTMATSQHEFQKISYPRVNELELSKADGVGANEVNLIDGDIESTYLSIGKKNTVKRESKFHTEDEIEFSEVKTSEVTEIGSREKEVVKGATEHQEIESNKFEISAASFTRKIELNSESSSTPVIESDPKVTPETKSVIVEKFAVSDKSSKRILPKGKDAPDWSDSIDIATTNVQDFGTKEIRSQMTVIDKTKMTPAQQVVETSVPKTEELDSQINSDEAVRPEVFVSSDEETITTSEFKKDGLAPSETHETKATKPDETKYIKGNSKI